MSKKLQVTVSKSAIDAVVCVDVDAKKVFIEIDTTVFGLRVKDNSILIVSQDARYKDKSVTFADVSDKALVMDILNAKQAHVVTVRKPPAEICKTRTKPTLDASLMIMFKEQLLSVIDSLTPREQKVIRLRYGIDDAKPRTLEEVGREFSVTRERIRQIEAKALRKMRNPNRTRRLRDFIEES